MRIIMNTSKTTITITASTSIHHRRRASQRQEVLSLPVRMFNTAIRISTIHNLATSNIQLMAQSHCRAFPIYVATSQRTSWRALPTIIMVAARITTKIMWPMRNLETKDRSSSPGSRKRRASAQGARRAQMAQEVARTTRTQSSPARVIGSAGTIFATCARLILRMWRRSSILAIANIRFVMTATITRCRPRRGSALTAASTMR
mgnify:CR=1 FL=1